MTLGLGWKWGYQWYHGLKEPRVAGGPIGDGRKSRLIWVLLWALDVDPDIVIYIFNGSMHMVISSFTLHGPNTSKWLGPMVDADLLDLRALHTSSSWVSSLRSSRPPNTHLCLVECFIAELLERYVVVTLVYTSIFRKPTPLKFNKLFFFF